MLALSLYSRLERNRRKADGGHPLKGLLSLDSKPRIGTPLPAGVTSGALHSFRRFPDPRRKLPKPTMHDSAKKSQKGTLPNGKGSAGPQNGPRTALQKCVTRSVTTRQLYKVVSCATISHRTNLAQPDPDPSANPKFDPYEMPTVDARAQGRVFLHLRFG